MSAEDDKRQGEMLDKYRDSGTLDGVLMIDRKNLDLLIEDRINKGMIKMLEKKLKKLKAKVYVYSKK